MWILFTGENLRALRFKSSEVLFSIIEIVPSIAAHRFDLLVAMGTKKIRMGPISGHSKCEYIQIEIMLFILSFCQYLQVLVVSLMGGTTRYMLHD